MRPKYMRWTYAIKPNKLWGQMRREGTYEPHRDRLRNWTKAYIMVCRATYRKEMEHEQVNPE